MDKTPFGHDEIDPAQAIGPQIYEKLREKIVRTELLPGEIISETEVARNYEVSRQPVREAFIKLVQAGLVTIRPQRGTMITRISASAVMDASFVREAIEAEIVKLVASIADAAVVRELSGQVAHQRTAGEADSDEFVRLDELFHRTLADIAGKHYAWRVIQDVKAQVDRVRYLSVESVHVRFLIREHERIVRAIENADPAEAEAAMRTHLRGIVDVLPAVARARPELFLSSAELTPVIGRSGRR